MPKNIVVCCDGTGNQFGDCNSNVVKLYRAAMIDNAQVGYYHPGVGTMGSPMAQGAIQKTWSKVLGLGFGAGFMDHVEDAYRYLMGVYDDGDNIYLFGFSRGAYTARALAAILYSYGLLCKGNEGHIPYIWAMFEDEMKAAHKSNKKKTKGHRKTSLDLHGEFKATFSHCVNLHFVGLWDTVSSVGWVTEPVKLLYSAQNPSIQTGRHAISLDERRCFFVDNLWGPALKQSDPDGKWKQEMSDLAWATQGKGLDVDFLTLEQDIFQAWFAGVHSDVGGSYPQKESALSNVTLRWMLREAKAAGLLVKAEREEMLFGNPPAFGPGIEPLSDAHLYKKPHPTWETQKIHQSLNGAWWLLELLPHRYYDKDDEDKQKIRIPLGHARNVPDGSVIHGSVVARIEHPESRYKPSNLNVSGLERHSPTTLDGTDFAEFYVYRKDPAAPAQVTAETMVKGVAAVFAAAIGLGLLLRRLI